MADKDNHLATLAQNTSVQLSSEVKGLIPTYQELNPTEIQALQSVSSPLGILSKENKESVQAFVEFAIIDLMAFVNVPRQMSQPQIQATAKLIVQKYGHFKIEDVKLVFVRFKTGQVKIYEGLDGMKICSGFEQWSEERVRLAEEKNYSEHQNTKEAREYHIPEIHETQTLKQVADESYFKK